jgi:hypothetical protein
MAVQLRLWRSRTAPALAEYDPFAPTPAGSYRGQPYDFFPTFDERKHR